MRFSISRGAALGAALALAACGRGDRAAAGDTTAVTDSALARDLALAAAPAPADVPLSFGDTAYRAPSAPAPAARTPRPRPATTTTAPARATPRPSTAPRPIPSAPPPAAEPAPAPAPAPARSRGIAAGTGLSVATGSAVCTKNLPGDKLVATLSQDVTGADGAVLRAGSKVVLEVASVNRGDGSGNGARIDFRVRAVDDGTRSYPAAADGSATGPFERTALARNKGSDAKKVIGGAIAGAILGQVIGKDTKGTVIGAAAGAAAGTVAAKAGGGGGYDSCLPAGATVRLTLHDPIVM